MNLAYITLECACVLIVSAALAQSFGAIVHYQDDDLLYSAEQLVKDARGVLQDGGSVPQRITKKPWWRLW